MTFEENAKGPKNQPKTQKKAPNPQKRTEFDDESADPTRKTPPIESCNRKTVPQIASNACPTKRHPQDFVQSL